MRMMLKWSLPTDAGNKMIKDGEVGKVLGPLLEAMKPEAAYWFASGGTRGGLFVFDLAESSDIPKYRGTLVPGRLFGRALSGDESRRTHEGLGRCGVTRRRRIAALTESR